MSDWSPMLDPNMPARDAAALRSVQCRFAVAAIADITQLALIAGVLERSSKFTLPQLLLTTRMKLHNIEVIGAKTLETAVDAGFNQCWRPIIES